MFEIEDVLHWRNQDTNFLALEECSFELLNAKASDKIPKKMLDVGLSGLHGFNTIQMAHFLSELCERFIFVCKQYDFLSKKFNIALDTIEECRQEYEASDIAEVGLKMIEEVN